MAALSPSSSYISSLVRIRQANKHALTRPRLPSIDPGIRTRRVFGVKAAANLAPNWDAWKPDQGSKAPSLSDIIWPSAGAFAAMAVLGKMDEALAKKGVSMTIAPLGAVCAVLFATPSTPGARKYNMFIAQMGCAAIGVLAFSFLGPGWLARSTALSASLAFMIYFRAIHPPAASLPLLFIDGAKFHQLKFWYVLFPGAAGCILLCLIVSFCFEKRFRVFKTDRLGNGYNVCFFSYGSGCVCPGPEVSTSPTSLSSARLLFIIFSLAFT